MDINQPVQGQQNNQQNTEPAANVGHSCCGGGFKNTKISTLIGVLVLVVIASVVAVLVLLDSSLEPDRLQVPAQVMMPKVSTPQPNRQTQTPVSQTEEDTTAAISEQLNNVTVTDLDGQFRDIDADLNNL